MLGGGSFYTHQWGLGILDLLLWPFSVLWDPIAAHEGAEVINYDMSNARARDMMRKDLRNLDDKFDAKEITDDEHRRKKRVIEDRYTFD